MAAFDSERSRGTAEMASFAEGAAAAVEAMGGSLLKAGLRLRARLQNREPGTGRLRRLYPCMAPECTCAGLWFTSFGGSTSSLVLDIDLEAGSCEEGSAPSPLVLRARRAFAANFASSAPDVSLFYNGCRVRESRRVELPKDTKAMWLDGGSADPSGAVGPAGGSWRFFLRPDRLTEDSLAQCRIRYGGNVLLTAGFEVRTKPAEWVLLEGLVAARPAPARESCARAAVRAAILADSTCASPATDEVARSRRKPAAHDEAAARADEWLAKATFVLPPERPEVAFVRLQNRTQANAVVRGSRAFVLLKSSTHPVSGASTASAGGRGRRSTPCPSSLLPGDLSALDLEFSFLPSLNKAHREGHLGALPLPPRSLAEACPAFVQRDDGFIRPDDAASAGALGVRMTADGAPLLVDAATAAGSSMDGAGGPAATGSYHYRASGAGGGGAGSVAAASYGRARRSARASRSSSTASPAAAATTTAAAGARPPRLTGKRLRRSGVAGDSTDAAESAASSESDAETASFSDAESAAGAPRTKRPAPATSASSAAATAAAAAAVPSAAVLGPEDDLSMGGLFSAMAMGAGDELDPEAMDAAHTPPFPSAALLRVVPPLHVSELDGAGAASPSGFSLWGRRSPAPFGRSLPSFPSLAFAGDEEAAVAAANARDRVVLPLAPSESLGLPLLDMGADDLSARPSPLPDAAHRAHLRDGGEAWGEELIRAPSGSDDGEEEWAAAQPAAQGPVDDGLGGDAFRHIFAEHFGAGGAAGAAPMGGLVGLGDLDDLADPITPFASLP